MSRLKIDINRFRWLLTAVLPLFAAQPAFADGEQLENGAVWVDPVEHFKLQDIFEHDCTRAYDQGDIDFNKVLKKSGTKVFGLKLRPIAGADEIENGSIYNNSLDLYYSDIMGIRGVPLSEPPFCVYADESVTRTYNFEYQAWERDDVSNDDGKRPTLGWTWTHNIQVTINNLHLVTTQDGLGFSYSIDHHYKSTGSGNGKTKSWDLSNKEPLSYSGDPLTSHFIYFEGARELLLVIGDALKDKDKVLDKSFVGHPRYRIYFEVEEIMIQPDEPATVLTEEDKKDLVNFSEDVMTWLRGEGDPLGLGEHTDAKESVAIEVLGTLAAILLGSGAIGFIGGTGAEIAGGLTNIIASSTPPPVVPDLPPQERDPLRRKDDDDDDDGKSTPPPPDDRLFHPTDYPDLCRRYLRENEEGTLVFTSPVTGQKTEYYPLPDGSGWVKSYSQNETVYSSQELEERVRYEAENRLELRKIYDQAAYDIADQRKKWNELLEDDRKNHGSKEQLEFAKWRKAQEDKLEVEMRTEKMALKYGTTVDKIHEKLSRIQEDARMDAKAWMDVSKQYDKLMKVAEFTDKVCEFSVNVMGECIPGGRVVKNAYTFAKSTLVAASEAANSNMSFKEGLAHVASGAGQGALGVIQNQAGDLSKNWLGEYAITVSTEAVKDGMKIYEKTGDLETTIYGMINSSAKKTGDFALGKGISWGFGTLKSVATQSLTNKTIHIDKNLGIRIPPKYAKKILTFFNPRGKLTTTSSKGWNIDYKGTNADMNKLGLGELSKKFSFTGGWKGTADVVKGGQVSVEGLLSTKATEAASKFSLHKWEGQTAEGLVKDAVGFRKDLITLKERVIRNAKKFGEQQANNTGKK